MRQLHVIPYYEPAVEFGGVQTVCRRLAEAMAARGHAVTVLTTDVASRTARLPDANANLAGVDVVRVRNRWPELVRYNLYSPADFRAQAAALVARHDLVHVHDVFNWLTYVAVDEARRQRRPSVLSSDNLLGFHGRPERVLARRLLYRLLGQRTVAAADLVHALRADELDPAALGIDPGRVRVIPNGVDLPPPPGDGARFRRQHGITAPHVVLFVGQLLRGKGVDLVLAAARRLVERRDVVFVCAGYRGPDLDALMGGAVPSNVVFTGFLTGRALADAYSAASLYLLPSRAEGLPMTALEALSYGIPSLLSHDCHLPDVATAGAGLVVAAELEAVCAGLTALFDAEPAWPTMAAAARAFVAERYALDRVHDQYEQLYRDLLST